ncbi:hypothetical protein HYW32_02050 [Candidatus Berkelbacteria bacterium]|nr:hypothetical protein [Candidatus Berkelbacteria bacterium]
MSSTTLRILAVTSIATLASFGIGLARADNYLETRSRVDDFLYATRISVPQAAPILELTLSLPEPTREEKVPEVQAEVLVTDISESQENQSSVTESKEISVSAGGEQAETQVDVKVNGESIPLENIDEHGISIDVDNSNTLEDSRNETTVDVDINREVSITDDPPVNENTSSSRSNTDVDLDIDVGGNKFKDIEDGGSITPGKVKIDLNFNDEN